MYPQTQSVNLFNAVTPVTVTSSTDATPIVVTATAHGLVTGQRVLIYGHTTNVAANGIFKVGVTTANTFQLLDEITGAAVAGSGAGAGSGGICMIAPPVLFVKGFRNIILQVGTSGGATMTLKAAGSLGRTGSFSVAPRESLPNIGATVSPANPYNFLQLIPLDTDTPIAGNTGIALSATDVNNNYEVNTNALEYFTFFPTAWTAGVITVKALLTTNS